jgi:hypothetical protein
MNDEKVFYQGEEAYIMSCNYLIQMELNSNDELIVKPKNYGWEQFNDQTTAISIYMPILN